MSEEFERKKKPKAGAPAWMVTYSDLVTLLLTFFVLLLSMANMDPVRFTSASQSMKVAFGLSTSPQEQTRFNIPVVIEPQPIVKFTPITQSSSQKVYQKAKQHIESLRLHDKIELIQKDGSTIILRLDDSILFKPGQTELSIDSYLLLRNVADIIRPLPVMVRIEGHSDDTPAQTALHNWNISCARAVSVMRFLYRSKLLDIDRMAAAGYGDDRPVVENNNAENRAKNRRVDFVLKVAPPTKTPTTSNALPL